MVELFATRFFNKYRITLLVIYGILTVIQGYQPGDRISALSQISHNHLQTAHLDLPLPQMPRFAMADSFIFHANLPQQATQNNTG